MSSDTDLVAGVLAREQPAWAEWNSRFRPVLAGIARREFRMPPEDIDDLWQDLSLSLLDRNGRQLRAYRQEASLRSWLCAIWRHRCLDFKRRQTVRVKSWLDLHQHTHMLCARHPVESRLLARQALGLAGARDRMFLQMYFIQGWSQKDIAAQLQAPENTVASCLARARLRVQKIVVTPVPPRASK